MAGNTDGMQTLIKPSAPHCRIHRESLATEELFPEQSEAVDTVIRSVNFIKTRPLETRLFAELCEEMGTQYQ
jgi:hypothetical protein